MGEHRWITIPVEGQEEPEEPAPAVRLVAAASEHGASQAKPEESTPGAEETRAGTVEPEGGSGTDGLTILALILGIAGVLMGGGALARVRKA